MLFLTNNLLPMFFPNCFLLHLLIQACNKIPPLQSLCRFRSQHLSMKSKNTVRNYTEKVFEGELPFLAVDGDVVSIDGKAYWEFIKMTCDYMSIDICYMESLQIS